MRAGDSGLFHNGNRFKIEGKRQNNMILLNLNNDIVNSINIINSINYATM